mmetsp:Transcript_6980/g.15228  ORF Transcript_6980/g.15228 Transcript_6980/m.15228 type:complete len:210 (+) Transcript_6980:166-795(+)
MTMQSWRMRPMVVAAVVMIPSPSGRISARGSIMRQKILVAGKTRTGSICRTVERPSSAAFGSTPRTIRRLGVDRHRPRMLLPPTKVLKSTTGAYRQHLRRSFYLKVCDSVPRPWGSTASRMSELRHSIHPCWHAGTTWKSSRRRRRRLSGMMMGGSITAFPGMIDGRSSEPPWSGSFSLGGSHRREDWHGKLLVFFAQMRSVPSSEKYG